MFEGFLQILAHCNYRYKPLTRFIYKNTQRINLSNTKKDYKQQLFQHIEYFDIMKALWISESRLWHHHDAMNFLISTLTSSWRYEFLSLNLTSSIRFLFVCVWLATISIMFEFAGFLRVVQVLVTTRPHTLVVEMLWWMTKLNFAAMDKFQTFLQVINKQKHFLQYSRKIYLKLTLGYLKLTLVR